MNPGISYDESLLRRQADAGRTLIRIEPFTTRDWVEFAGLVVFLAIGTWGYWYL